MDLLKKAEEIAGEILGQNSLFSHKKLKDAGLMVWLPFLRLQQDLKEGKKLNTFSLDPKILEIFLFGSVARGQSTKESDIDMMVIDTGFFSDFFELDSDKEDWYLELSSNIKLLLVTWFEMGERQFGELLSKVKVDLHILPVKLLKSKKFREEVTEKHKDKNFLVNAFETMMVFDRYNKKFSKITVEELEKKYNTDLSDLKR